MLNMEYLADRIAYHRDHVEAHVLAHSGEQSNRVLAIEKTA